MFLLKNAFLEIFGSVFGKHGDTDLLEDGTLVVDFVDDVDGSA